MREGSGEDTGYAWSEPARDEAARLARDAADALRGLFTIGTREAVSAIRGICRDVAETAAPLVDSVRPAIDGAADIAGGVMRVAGTGGAVVLTGAAVILATAAGLAVAAAEVITPGAHPPKTNASGDASDNGHADGAAA